MNYAGNTGAAAAAFNEEEKLGALTSFEGRLEHLVKTLADKKNTLARLESRLFGSEGEAKQEPDRDSREPKLVPPQIRRISDLIGQLEILDSNLAEHIGHLSRL